MLEHIKNGIRLADAAELIPGRNGKSVQVATLKRWITHGCRGVKLRGWKIGAAWYTSPAALEEFQRACTPESALPIVPSKQDEQRTYKATMKRLERLGMKFKSPAE